MCSWEAAKKGIFIMALFDQKFTFCAYFTYLTALFPLLPSGPYSNKKKRKKKDIELVVQTIAPSPS